MDPFEQLNLVTETSLLCMEELLSRGHGVFWIEQPQLSLINGRLAGMAARVRSVAPFSRDPSDTIDINALDALLIRKDPPFGKSYLHLTWLLDFLADEVVQINSPAALRHVNEKLYTLNWPEYCPETLVSQDAAMLMAFVSSHDKVVLKPLDDCSGRGIEFVRAVEEDAAARVRAMVAREGYVLAQAFLPAVRQGDKRVYLVDGKPVGWVNRIPAPGKDLANIHQGAVCQSSKLSAQERKISEVVGADLVRQGIILAGLDFIDERLTEINVTSPSAVRQINEVNGSHLERVIVDAILARVDYSRTRLAS
jgi:glutathione synthase